MIGMIRLSASKFWDGFVKYLS